MNQDVVKHHGDTYDIDPSGLQFRSDTPIIEHQGDVSLLKPVLICVHRHGGCAQVERDMRSELLWWTHQYIVSSILARLYAHPATPPPSSRSN